MTQPPLPGMPPTGARTTITDRRAAALQALLDALFPGNATNWTPLTVEYRGGGWWLCGEPRWFGDTGRDYIGKHVEEAEWRIRELRRMEGKR